MSTSQPLRHELPRDQLESMLNLGAGEDYREGFTNVDAVDIVDPDFVVDLEHDPWPFPDEQFEFILASHVLEHLPDMEGALREIRRVLVPGGRADIRLPVGVDATADPDHTWGESGKPWTYRTPLFFTGERHWDVDVGLSVVERDVQLWSLYTGVEKYRHHARLKWRERRHGQGEWMFNQPATCGEFRVVFEK